MMQEKEKEKAKVNKRSNLYYKLNQLNGLVVKDENITQKEKESSIELLVNTVINMLNKKLVITDCILVLAFEFCKQMGMYVILFCFVLCVLINTTQYF